MPLSTFEQIKQSIYINSQEVDSSIPTIFAEDIFKSPDPVEDISAFPIDDTKNHGETLIVEFRNGNRYLTHRLAHSYIKDWAFIVD